MSGCIEFFEKEQDDLIIFNYKFCSRRTFPDPNTAPDPETKRLWSIRRELRGIHNWGLTRQD